MALTCWNLIHSSSAAFLYKTLLLFLVLNILWRNCHCTDNSGGNPASTISASLLGPGLSSCEDPANCLDGNLTSELRKKCPNLRSQVLVIPAPISMNQEAGVLRQVTGITNIENCAAQCCSTDGCNIILMVETTCFLLFCNKGVEVCVPESVFNVSAVQTGKLPNANVSMVFVQSPQPMIRNESLCEQGLELEQCQAHEECVSKSNRARNGQCECSGIFIRNSQGKCIPIPDDSVNSEATTQSIRSVDQIIEVTVKSKNVTLPINEASLFAQVIPKETTGNPYTYEWLLISHPSEDPAALEGQTTNTLQLTRLKQGSYIFQIKVKGRGGSGSTNATVTVFPEKRINQVPVAVISPPDQTVQLPTSSAVLDAGSSSDDDKIISYKWELQKGPIDYTFNPQSTNSSTLQVTELKPGNYTFKLTVEDTDHATNSTTSSITVMKEIDYPPTANAGEDVVLYLPQTEVTLNGNASSDDKKIELWEWKASGDMNKAVDIQDTHTPYLKLSHLQEGIYQFELRVTDVAGQQSNPSTVHVFVKPPSGKPPTANAGIDQILALPENSAILDASESKSDTKILKWQWSQLSGPNNATIEKVSEVKTNVTGLTKGDYVFQVEIEDDAKLTSNDTIKVTVAQKINKPPKAVAGEDVNVVLPLTIVHLNGIGSTDDVQVTEWKWERQPESVAAGVVLGNSSFNSLLQLTDLVPGKYVFKLTVKDEQGLTDSDTVELTVSDDPRKRNLVEIIIGVPITMWTQENQDKLIQQLSLLVHDKLVLHHVAPQPHTEFTVLVLYALTEEGETVKGLQLASDLKQRLEHDLALLSFPLKSIDTVLCLDPCSGHGICQDFSDRRECVCNAFWMQNFLKKDFFGSGTERNCDWSKIYVAVVFTLLMTMFFAVIWSLTFLFRRNMKSLKGTMSSKVGNGTANGSARHGPSHKRHHSNKKQYTLLDDDEIELEIKADEADSDTSDSEVSLVEVKRTPKGSYTTSNLLSSSSSNGIGRSNGILKHGRGVKA